MRFFFVYVYMLYVYTVKGSRSRQFPAGGISVRSNHTTYPEWLV